MEFRSLLDDPNKALAMRMYMCPRGDGLCLIIGFNWECRVCSECLMLRMSGQLMNLGQSVGVRWLAIIWEKQECEKRNEICGEQVI